MGLNLAGHERRTRLAVEAFWTNREQARARQQAMGGSDAGERASVTAGKNMDGFTDLVGAVVRANGLSQADIHQQRAFLTLPGYYRPTKLWDLLVMYKGQLIAALEFKSQVGPSFGNNFNNRAEEAIGTAHDFWTAFREGGFGQQMQPFLGWLMLVEDAPASRAPVRERSPHFPVLKGFESASHLQRYDLLCQRLMQEHLYTAASVIASPKSADKAGRHTSLSEPTSFKALLAGLAGHVAAAAARLG